MGSVRESIRGIYSIFRKHRFPKPLFLKNRFPKPLFSQYYRGSVGESIRGINSIFLTNRFPKPAFLNITWFCRGIYSGNLFEQLTRIDSPNPFFLILAGFCRGIYSGNLFEQLTRREVLYGGSIVGIYFCLLSIEKGGESVSPFSIERRQKREGELGNLFLRKME